MIIAILDFIKTGKFGVVELGQKYQEIKKIFPIPDDVSKTGKRSYIWCYSAFELHFIDGILTLLWCDNLAYMYSPRKKQFKLDRWILDKYQKLTLSKFMEALDKEGTSYSISGTFYTFTPNEGLPDNVILNVDGTLVQVYFEDPNQVEKTIYDYEIIAIGASELKSTHKVYPL